MLVREYIFSFLLKNYSQEWLFYAHRIEKSKPKKVCLIYRLKLILINFFSYNKFNYFTFVQERLVQGCVRFMPKVKVLHWSWCWELRMLLRRQQSFLVMESVIAYQGIIIYNIIGIFLEGTETFFKLKFGSAGQISFILNSSTYWVEEEGLITFQIGISLKKDLYLVILLAYL